MNLDYIEHHSACGLTGHKIPQDAPELDALDVLRDHAVHSVGAAAAHADHLDAAGRAQGVDLRGHGQALLQLIQRRSPWDGQPRHIRGRVRRQPRLARELLLLMLLLLMLMPPLLQLLGADVRLRQEGGLGLLRQERCGGRDRDAEHRQRPLFGHHHHG
jgi:hypothetical protein